MPSTVGAFRSIHWILNYRAARQWRRVRMHRLSRRLRQIPPKPARTINLVLILAAAIGLALPLWAPVERTARHVTATEMPLIPAPVAVTIIDATPRGARCEEQTWPYIERQCLSYAPGQPQAAATVAADPKTLVDPNPQATSERPANGQEAPPRTAALPQPREPDRANEPKTRRDDRALAQAPLARSRLVESKDGIENQEDVSGGQDDVDEVEMSEDEARAQAAAEARHRRRARSDGPRDIFGHYRRFSIGPFRF